MISQTLIHYPMEEREGPLVFLEDALAEDLTKREINAASKSARRLAHSKTWRLTQRRRASRSVLECASPLALFPKDDDYILRLKL